MAEQLMKAMGRLMKLARAYRDKQFGSSQFHLTEREAAILDICSEDEVSFVSEISRRLVGKGTSQTTISQTVTSLWQRGFVQKVVDPTNPKVISVQLTDLGREFLEERRRLDAERAELLLSEIRTPEEKEVIEGYMNRMSQRFKELLGGG